MPAATLSHRNVIWIFGDQHRAAATGYMGDPNVRTPNLDRMALDGVNFRNAVGGFPLSCPFRGSLLTSRYPHQCVPGHEYQMPAGMPTIANVMHDAGYMTAYYGKWHLDGFKEATGRAAKHHVPPERRGGFGTWIGYENNNNQYDCWVHGHDEELGEVPHYKLGDYETDALTDLFIEYLTRRSGDRQPFFGVLSVQPPHDPNLADERFLCHYNPAQLQLRPNVPHNASFRHQVRQKLAGYYAQIENLDWNIGRIRAALRKLGLEENTYIMFFSDHGDMMGSHGQFAKTTPYAESLHIPCLISGGVTGYQTALHPCMPTTVDAPFNHVDFAPTTLGLCGVEIPEFMAGTDYSNYVTQGWRAEVDAPGSAFIQQNISTGHGPAIDRPWRGIVTDDGWKYAVLEGQPWMLFNTNEDPYEQNNMALYGRTREIRRKLQDRLTGWINDTGDSFQLPEI